MRWLVCAVLLGCVEGDANEDANADANANVDANADADASADADAVADANADAGCAPVVPSPPRVESCGTGTCLIVGGKSIKVSDAKDACAGSIHGERVREVPPYISVVHCPAGALRIDVVDPIAGSIVASAVAPKNQKHAWTDALKDGSGELHPFLASSYGDADPPDPTYGVGTTWGAGCVFDPSREDVARCGKGFAYFSANPGTNWFREVGGYLTDVDGDGFEDPTFIFHEQVLTISGRTGAELSRVLYDVAASTEPTSPKWFHSGRNYGTHTAVGTRVIEVGAAPNGTFEDYNCNVSRFLAVIDLRSKSLVWSTYKGFASTIFSTTDPKYAADPSPVITRKGNFVDRCVHRFSDSRTTIDGKPSVVYNIFHGATVATCLTQQYALYLGDPADPDPEKRPWSASKQKAWGDCQTANIKAKGQWAMEALGEADGSSVTGGVGNYVWGWTNKMVPGGETLYLVEQLPAEHRFDLSDVPAPKLEVRALIKGLWTPRGVFPVAGRPKMVMASAAGARGLGSYSAFAELSLRDVDCDGVPEVELADGTFVGWNGASFVVKK